jgi:hypothetical protein
MSNPVPLPVPNPPVPSAPPSSSGRIWIPLVSGVVLGVVLWSLIGPMAVGWWSGPLLADGLSCGPTVERAVVFFVKVELGAAVVGGLLTLLFVSFVRRKISRT